MNTVAKWLTAAAMTVIGSASHAQDTQFNVIGQFNLGGNLSGELMIDTVKGSVDSGSLTVSGLPSFVSELNGTYAGTIDFGASSGHTYVDVFSATYNSPYVFLGLPVSSLTGYAGGPLGTVDPIISSVDGVSHSVNIISGSITAAAVAAPEIDPASAATGLALLIGTLLVLRGRRSGEAAA